MYIPNARQTSSRKELSNTSFLTDSIEMQFFKKKRTSTESVVLGVIHNPINSKWKWDLERGGRRERESSWKIETHFGGLATSFWRRASANKLILPSQTFEVSKTSPSKHWRHSLKTEGRNENIWEANTVIISTRAQSSCLSSSWGHNKTPPTWNCLFPFAQRINEACNVCKLSQPVCCVFTYPL